MTGPALADRVTVVVMSRDRWPDLHQTLPRHESSVILVDNGSTDGTPTLCARHHPEVRVIDLGRNLGASARNVGVRAASTPYVAFADDDSWWEPGALAEAADVLDRHENLGAVVARVLLGVEGTPDPICADLASSPLPADGSLPGPAVLGFPACAAVVRRDAFLAAGGFDEVVFFVGEEERLSLDLAAAGWAVSYVDRLVARHHPSPNRNPIERRALAARNRLLTSVMRRPWPVVAQDVLRELRGGRAGIRAVAQAAARVRPALASRQRLPPHVEAARRLLD